MTSPQLTPTQPNQGLDDEPESPSKMATPLESSNSSLSNYLEHATPTSISYNASPSSILASSIDSHSTPTRSASEETLTIQLPPNGGGSQTKRHSMRSPSSSQHSLRLASLTGPPSSMSLDRTMSSQSINTSQTLYPYPPRPTSPITSPSIHKSLTALDAKSITRDMEKSSQQMRNDDMILTSPSSPSASNNPSGFYFSNVANGNGNTPYQPMTAQSIAPSMNYAYHRQGSISSVTLNSVAPSMQAVLGGQGDVWQTFCVRVLPLFNGEGVQGSIEDLNELLRRCLTDPVSPQLYRDMEALLRDGMFTLNAKMFGVTDEKLLDRLVEQWSFFFTYALPYFEAVFLPLRTDVRYRNAEEEEMWNVRNMALRSFRDNVILLQTKRLEDVFAKLFTDFGSSQNPASTAAKMLQMTSLLASSTDHNEDIERVLSSLKANWKIMMTKGDRRGFAGVRKAHSGKNPETSHIFGALAG
ncbi:hypothetical protein PHYBLDRAFT_61508 [Phycomyces blakesleeanus NRRL 1555(-)]|uniref:HbrB-like protein n=2 Tax=Phycomyces blakesleeanus TaxID=4837 RepID=A0A167QY45_PHYB8|nr:hypothetical protein PHYBLDRAFT_61508 [Phycomyces blakesleeanus NRRL 1555(-)]OAD80457.1 hypothetical protein PHYBLDRAFT_61508 [Phycomyces blakesleeanus NRRL 1555(-)]|eukprot:XP_018298497.1 hypothetical protein PHYBLDRAFT_61508 [Phycomyces blakesleeanus NRRL 1555(-)]